jgi:hypothetical protein
MYFRKYFGLAIAGLFALSLLLLIIKIAAPARNNRGGKEMLLVCNQCSKPLPYEGARCSYCKWVEAMRSAGVGAPEAHATRELSPVGKLAIASGILGLLTIVAYWPQVRYLIKKWTTKPEQLLTMRCKKCKRKLRYSTSSIGKSGLCPGCGLKFDFPNADGRVPLPGETATAK